MPTISFCYLIMEVNFINQSWAVEELIVCWLQLMCWMARTLLLLRYCSQVLIQYLFDCKITFAHFCCRYNEDDSSCYSSHDGNKERYNCECWKYYCFGTWTMGWCVFSVKSCSSCIERFNEVPILILTSLFQHQNLEPRITGI